MKKDTKIKTLRLTSETGSSPVTVRLVGRSTRLAVTVERGVSATVFDTSTSDTHAVTVTLDPESSLDYISLSSGSSRTFASVLADGARMFWHCITLGDSGKHSLVSTCDGAHAKSDVDWIFAVKGSEKQSVTVRNIFAGRNGGGEITLKGVAQGKAYAECNGMIEITEQGTGTDTYLTEDVLMLDPTATVDAIPALEIRTNDVKASHSATVSRVTAEDLFYFQSRGIDSQQARSMYVEGFLGELTERIADPTIRGEVLNLL